MDLKLVFYVLSLILLVAYGAEARKMVGENIQGKRLNSQAKTENAQVSNILLYGDLQNKDGTQNNQGYNYNHQQAKTENAQVSNILLYGDLQNKDGTQNNQGNQQQAKTENAQVSNILLYGDLQKNQTSWIHNKEGGKKHKTENANAHILDPSLRVFFLMEDVKLSKEICVSFPRRASNFLPKDEADSIPFSLKELPNLLQRFSISRNSPQAKAMEETLRICEIPPIKGETKYCATSPEAMLDFVQEAMGEVETQIKSLSTTHFSNSTPLLQKYTILDAPQEVETHKMVACHTMPYAYTIFYCHYTISKSKVFKVSLGGENGDRVEAIAVCHLDTSHWSPSHVSFRVLGVLPGTSPICHFFPSVDMVWVPKIATTQVI